MKVYLGEYVAQAIQHGETAAGYLITYNRNDHIFMPSEQFNSDDATEKARELAHGYNDVMLAIVECKIERISF